MSVQRSSHLIARLGEAAQEEATATICERAQASDPPTEQGRGAARTAGASQDPSGQVVDGEDKEADNKEINANSCCHKAEVRAIASKSTMYWDTKNTTGSSQHSI